MNSHLKISADHKQFINNILKGKIKFLEASRTQMFMSDIFMFALALGFKNKKREKISKPENSIPVTRIEGKYAIDGLIIRTIAMMETNDPDIYYNEAECFKIAEEYANAGLIMLSTEYEEKLKFKNFILENFEEWKRK